MNDSNNKLTPASNEEEAAFCDGGSETLGHPAVYLPFNAQNSVTCYYCGRLFTRSERESIKL